MNETGRFQTNFLLKTVCFRCPPQVFDNTCHFLRLLRTFAETIEYIESDILIPSVDQQSAHEPSDMTNKIVTLNAKCQDILGAICQSLHVNPRNGYMYNSKRTLSIRRPV